MREDGAILEQVIMKVGNLKDGPFLQRGSILLLSLAICCIIFMNGCHLPNVESFAKNVAEVHRGVDRSGIVIHENAIRILGEEHEATKTFANHWQKRRKATEALVHYADALADTVKASNKSSQNVEAFASAVDDLGFVMGQVGLVGSEAFQMAGEFYKLGVKVAAYHTLSKAVKATHSAIRHVCYEILVKDLQTMQKRLETVKQAVLAQYETEEMEEEENRLIKLKNKRKELYNELTKKWAQKHRTHLTQLSMLDELIGTIQLKINENTTKKHLDSQRIQAQIELLTRTIEAVKQVAVTHQ